MQRIQSWFDQLTIGRQSRRGNARRGRVGKKSAESVERRRCVNVADDATCQKRAASHSVVRRSRDELRPLPVFPPPPPSSCSSTMMSNNHVMNASFPRRNRIRTNPWIGESKMWDSVMSTSSMGRSQDSSKRIPPTLSVVSPDTSMCSSGYASHDSSPDTSIVWSTNEWKNYDNSNIYHELLDSPQDHLSASSCSSIRTPSPKYERVDSPIYAEPWHQYHNRLPTITTTTTTPLVVANCTYRPAASPPIYAQPFSNDTCHQPRHHHQRGIGKNEMDDEFLQELDQQIYQLQIRSEELREMVERARHQRKEYIIPKMECTFELAL